MRMTNFLVILVWGGFLHLEYPFFTFLVSERSSQPPEILANLEEGLDGEAKNGSFFKMFVS